ncbi:hypothetical protein FNV43_RR06377 [Rhamnella rubrinervis]|uniref:WPP domain-associated protein n=1 Tax=Rhamnella rubrinervis TaxID=2594499 RepID=A0A8K0HCX9_9ROSA|nr:hypothetical protein FNV43_RR06377 [Rhamnella rubrinervis]
MESLEVMDPNVGSCMDSRVQTSNNVKDSENLGVDFFKDLDSYFEDINDRLTISRMVSDSVIKGMVNAVSQEAAEKIAQKELEVAGMKEMLHFYHVATDEDVRLGSLALRCGSKSTEDRMCWSSVDPVVQHDRMKETLGILRNATLEQFKKLKKEINQIRGSSSMKRISSSSELVGLGGILHEKECGRWNDLDKTFDSLKTTTDTVYKQVEEMFHLSKASLFEWQHEQEFQAEIEALVIRSCIWSLEQEFEETLWDKICGDRSLNWLGRMNEISTLRQELDAISKSLSISDVGQLSSHGSLDGEECSNNKKSDHFHRKHLTNHVTSSSLLLEENGKHEELQTDVLENSNQTGVLENSDPTRLKHLSKDELINYYTNEMTKMKRNHESKVQEKTEECFILKRELLKERSSSLPLKKDKDIDILRKRIPEVILKLDDILMENEKAPLFDNNAESFSSLKDRLEMLLVENHELRDFLTDKKKEVKCLASQVSEAELKISQHSLSEAKLLSRIEYLESAIEDASIEASIGEDVFNCILREMMGQIKFVAEESSVEHTLMKEIWETIFKEAAHNAEPTSRYEVEDTDAQSIIVQGVSEIIYREAWKDAEEKLIHENEIRVSLEKEVLEKEERLKFEAVEKQRLNQEILFLAQEKEKLVQDAATALQEEKERYELTVKELEYLRDQTCKQESLISESSKESNFIKDKLVGAMEEIEQYKMNVGELNQKLELAVKELNDVDEERRKLHAAMQDKQNLILLLEANESAARKQLESVVVIVHGLLKAAVDFEFRVTENISKNCSRLKNLGSQSRMLIQKANILRRTGLLYKQRLDRKCSDLQKAEAEVDLLGDEVDTLLGLLEKIYIALDHYSPILQHYPGVIEILKLVKRELSRESTRSKAVIIYELLLLLFLLQHYGGRLSCQANDCLQASTTVFSFMLVCSHDVSRDMSLDVCQNGSVIFGKKMDDPVDNA